VGDFLTSPPATFSSSNSTGAGGGFIGAQYQFSKDVVFGVEANAIALFQRTIGTAPCNPAASCGPAAMRTVSIDPIWSAGGRLG
jgi:hypothetical protein